MTWSSIRLLSLCLALSFAPAWALDKSSVSKAETVGISSARLQRITDAMQADVKKNSIPGAIGVIYRKGKVAYFETAGMADVEHQKPIRPDTIFRIYSMSKPITSVGLMMLYEEGKFSLKDPVSKYLPQLAKLQVMEEGPSGTRLVKPQREVTIQDLLRHTAGMSYGLFSKSAVDDEYNKVQPLSAPNLDEFISRMGQLPLRYQPGTRWHYSVAVDVQGKLIEAISGMRFDKYLEERIFKPLGMVDTGFVVPKSKQARFAQMYGFTKDGKMEPADPKMSAGYFNEDLRMFSGGGGMVSTTSDYLRFCRMLLNGGELDGARILGRKTVELMSRDHLNEIPGREESGYGFGLGFAVHLNPGKSGLNGSVGEYNWGGLAGTKFWIDPKENLIGIYMVQVLPPRASDSGETFKELVYQSVVE